MNKATYFTQSCLGSVTGERDQKDNRTYKVDQNEQHEEEYVQRQSHQTVRDVFCGPQNHRLNIPLLLRGCPAGHFFVRKLFLWTAVSG